MDKARFIFEKGYRRGQFLIKGAIEMGYLDTILIPIEQRGASHPFPDLVEGEPIKLAKKPKKKTKKKVKGKPGKKSGRPKKKQARKGGAR